jgi:Family of unknown function (DUF5994)
MSAPTTLKPAAGATYTTDHHEPLRLKLKPKTATAVGQVDGAWWPRSRGLVLNCAPSYQCWRSGSGASSA